MVGTRLAFKQTQLDSLFRDPDRTIVGRLNDISYTLNIGIPHYRRNIAQHYEDAVPMSIEEVSRRAEIPLHFEHFGLICAFEEPIELDLYDEEMTISEELSSLIDRFGPVILKNATLSTERSEDGHHARFRHLNFHYDRGAHQREQHSLYYRDPTNPDQHEPRTSSTVFIENLVACLQHMKENGRRDVEEKGVRGTYDIFEEDEMEDLVGRIILEHRWDQPAGTGEISTLHNRKALHASYYRSSTHKGYRIGVRYLA